MVSLTLLFVLQMHGTEAQKEKYLPRLSTDMVRLGQLMACGECCKC